MSSIQPTSAAIRFVVPKNQADQKKLDKVDLLFLANNDMTDTFGLDTLEEHAKQGNAHATLLLADEPGNKDGVDAYHVTLNNINPDKPDTVQKVQDFMALLKERGLDYFMDVVGGKDQLNLANRIARALGRKIKKETAQ